MNKKQAQVQDFLKKARVALKAGNKKDAYAWAKRAAQLAPQTEDAWLILAAVSSPEKSIKFLEKALSINPNSPRAQKGMAWAKSKIPKETTSPSAPTLGAPPSSAISPMATLPSDTLSPAQSPPQRAPSPKPSAKPSPPTPEKKKSRLPLFLGGVFLIICLIGVSFLAFNTSTVQALFSNEPTATMSLTPQHWAQGTIAKPTYTPSITPTTANTSTPTLTPTLTFTPTETFTLTPSPTLTPTKTLTPTITNTPLPTNTFSPTNTPKPVPTSPPPVDGGTHWIEVNLSQQRLYAYAGNTLMNSFVVSTGTWQTPTVTGYFNVYLKYVSTTMSGPGYYLTNVPYTMYFHGDYGIHGTYWHNNFGTPMSHGCVNMRSNEAEWLYYFSPMGTLVYIHY